MVVVGSWQFCDGLLSQRCKVVTIPATTLDTEPSFFAPPGADSSSDEIDDQGLSPAEAARRLGVSRSRVYALVEQGALEEVAATSGRGGSLRISSGSVARRLQDAAPLGQRLSTSSAWAVLALASGDEPQCGAAAPVRRER
jgi:excisionase family DNA binding protein